jgi:hypothetical protein
MRDGRLLNVPGLRHRLWVQERDHSALVENRAFARDLGCLRLLVRHDAVRAEENESLLDIGTSSNGDESSWVNGQRASVELHIVHGALRCYNMHMHATMHGSGITASGQGPRCVGCTIV